MERDGNHGVSLSNQVPRRTANPLLKELSQIGPVGMFEPQDQVARTLIIETGRPGPRKGAWPGHTGRAKGPNALIELERNAAAITDRIIEETHLQKGVSRQSRSL